MLDGNNTPLKLPPILYTLRQAEPDNTSGHFRHRDGSQVDNQGLTHQQLHQPHRVENGQYQAQHQHQQHLQHPQPNEGHHSLEQPHQTLQEYPSHGYQAAQHPQPYEQIYENSQEHLCHGYQAARHFPNPPYHQLPEQANSHWSSPQGGTQYVDQHYDWGIMRETSTTVPSDLSRYPPQAPPAPRTQGYYPVPSRALPQPQFVTSPTIMNPHPRGGQPCDYGCMTHTTTPGRTWQHQEVDVTCVPQKTSKDLEEEEEEYYYQRRKQAMLRARPAANQVLHVQCESQVEPESVSRGSHAYYQKEEKGNKPQKPEQATNSYPARQEVTPQKTLADMSVDAQSSVSQPAPYHQTDNTTSSAAIDASRMTFQAMTAPSVQSQTLSYSPQSPTAHSKDNPATATTQEAIPGGVQMNGTTHPTGDIQSDGNAQVNGNSCPVANADTCGSPTTVQACPAGSTYEAAAGAQT